MEAGRQRWGGDGSKKLRGSLKARFATILARTFGEPNVSRMLARMPAPEFNRWLAAYIVDPWVESFKIELVMSDNDIIDTFRRLAESEKQ